jgi:IclR family transcriptional regulator, acetate operon repressor
LGTITKALTMLNFFSAEHSEIGLANFVRLTGRDKATVRRHLIELEENGFLEQNPASRGYRLGPSILRLAAVRELHFPAVSAAAPIVTEIAETLGELVHTALLQNNMMSHLYNADPQIHGTRVIFDEAEMLPLHATSSGLAMLAFGPPALEDIVLSGPLDPFTPKTVVDKSVLVGLIEQARERGFSFGDQGFTDEVFSFAVPIFGPEEIAVGTIAVPVPVSRLNDEKKSQILKVLKKGCEDASRSFGGKVPAHVREAWSRSI